LPNALKLLIKLPKQNLTTEWSNVYKKYEATGTPTPTESHKVWDLRGMQQSGICLSPQAEIPIYIAVLYSTKFYNSLHLQLKQHKAY